MEQQDYIRRQINQLAQVLGKLLADLLQIQYKENAQEIFENTDQILKKVLGFNIAECSAISKDTFLEILTKNENMSNENLEKLASLFNMLAQEHNHNIQLYEKSLLLYEYLAATDKTYNIDRQNKIAALKKRIAEH